MARPKRIAAPARNIRKIVITFGSAFYGLCFGAEVLRKNCGELLSTLDSSTTRYVRLLVHLNQSHKQLGHEITKLIATSKSPLNPLSEISPFLEATKNHVFREAFQDILREKDLDWTVVKKAARELSGLRLKERTREKTADDDARRIFLPRVTVPNLSPETTAQMVRVNKVFHSKEGVTYLVARKITNSGYDDRVMTAAGKIIFISRDGESISSLFEAPEGEILAVVQTSNHVRVVNIRTWRNLLKKHIGNEVHETPHQEEGHLVSNSKGKITLVVRNSAFDISTGLQKELKKSDFRLVSPSGDRIYGLNVDHKNENIRAFNVLTGKTSWEETFPNINFGQLAFSANDEPLLLVFDASREHIINLSDGNRLTHHRNESMLHTQPSFLKSGGKTFFLQRRENEHLLQSFDGNQGAVKMPSRYLTSVFLIETAPGVVNAVAYDSNGTMFYYIDFKNGQYLSAKAPKGFEEMELILSGANSPVVVGITKSARGERISLIELFSDPNEKRPE